MTKIYNIGIMTDEKNPILNPQAEGSNTASGRKNKGKATDTEGIFASSSGTLGDEKDLEIRKIRGKISEIEKELEDKVSKFGKTRYSSLEECEKENEKIVKLDTEIKELRKKLRKLEIEELGKKLSAKSYQGKEVIKAEISQKLIEAKGIFLSFRINETTQEEIKNKINKHVDRIENT